jgi:pilus assembly protein Flp/PilA
MESTIQRIRHKCQELSVVVLATEGQDLIEYALVAALIGFAAVAGMGSLANSINVAFSTSGTTLSSTA